MQYFLQVKDCIVFIKIECNLQAVLLFFMYPFKSYTAFQNKQLWFIAQFNSSWEWESKWEWYLNQFIVSFGSTLFSLTPVLFITVWKSQKKLIVLGWLRKWLLSNTFREVICFISQPIYLHLSLKSHLIYTTLQVISCNAQRRKNDWNSCMSSICFVIIIV